MIKKWLATRRRRLADLHFRTGYLYALDRRLFRDAEPLLSQLDLNAAIVKHPGFEMGYNAGLVHRFEVSAMHLAEAERRIACDSV